MTAPGSALPARRRPGGLSASRLHRSGGAAHRVLLIGGESLVRVDDVGDAGRSAEDLAEQLQSPAGGGVDLDVLWELGPALEAVARVRRPWRAGPYDAIVVLLPRGDAARESGRAVRARHAAVSRALTVLGSGTPVVVAAMSERMRSSAATASPAVPSAEAWDVVALPSDRPIVLSLGALFTRLTSAGAEGAGRRAEEQDEPSSRRASVETDAVQQQLGRRLDTVVTMARNSFDVDGATVNLLDADRLWTVAGAGAPTGQQPWHVTLCDQTIRRAGVTVFEDTWAVPAFDGDPIMHGPTPVRFYAGHSIEAVDGRRIGTLCVYDSDPHAAGTFDYSMLRDLALLAEGEILDAACTTDPDPHELTRRRRRS